MKKMLKFEIIATLYLKKLKEVQTGEFTKGIINSLIIKVFICMEIELENI